MRAGCAPRAGRAGGGGARGVNFLPLRAMPKLGSDASLRYVLVDQVTRFWRFRHALQIFCQLRGSMQMKSVVGHSLVHFLAARTPRGSLGGPVGARKRDRAAHVASGAEFIRALSGCPPGTWGWSGLIFCKTLIQDRRNRQNPIRITTRRRRKSKKTYKTRTDKCHDFGFPATGPNTPPTTTLLAEKKGGGSAATETSQIRT